MSEILCERVSLSTRALAFWKSTREVIVFFLKIAIQKLVSKEGAGLTPGVVQGIVCDQAKFDPMTRVPEGQLPWLRYNAPIQI